MIPSHTIFLAHAYLSNNSERLLGLDHIDELPLEVLGLGLFA